MRKRIEPCREQGFFSPVTNESAVQFGTDSRIHVGVAAKNLERSVAFYGTLFGQGPTKVRPRYAKFEVAEPPVNLALNEVAGATGPNHPVAHFGIQMKSTEAVRTFADRLKAAGKRPEVVLTAVARKLVVLANAILRGGKPWDAARANGAAGA